MRKLLVVAILLIAASSVALERPAIDASRLEWIRFAAAVEDSMHHWREMYYDCRIDLVDCEHDLWLAYWDGTKTQEKSGLKWWWIPVSVAGGVLVGSLVSR